MKIFNSILILTIVSAVSYFNIEKNSTPITSLINMSSDKTEEIKEYKEESTTKKSKDGKNHTYEQKKTKTHKENSSDSDKDRYYNEELNTESHYDENIY